MIAGDDGAADDLVELLRLLEELGTRRWLADTLELVAVVLSRRGEHEVAAVCLGASEDLRLAAGEMDGGVRVAAAEVRASVAAIEVALGSAACAAARRRGRGSTTAATSRALGALPSRPA